MSELKAFNVEIDPHSKPIDSGDTDVTFTTVDDDLGIGSPGTRGFFLYPNRGLLAVDAGDAFPIPDFQDPRVWVLKDPEARIVSVTSHEKPDSLGSFMLPEENPAEVIPRLYDDAVLTHIKSRWNARSGDDPIRSYQEFFLLFDFLTTNDTLFDEKNAIEAESAGVGVFAESDDFRTWMRTALELRQRHRLALDQIKDLTFALEQSRIRRFDAAKKGEVIGLGEAGSLEVRKNRANVEFDFRSALENVCALVADLFRLAEPTSPDPAVSSDAEHLALPFLAFAEGRTALTAGNSLNCRPDSAAFFSLAELAFVALDAGDTSYDWQSAYSLFICVQDAFVRWHGYPNDASVSNFATLRTPKKYSDPFVEQIDSIGAYHFTTGWKARQAIWERTPDRWHEMHASSLLAAFWADYLMHKGSNP